MFSIYIFNRKFEINLNTLCLGLVLFITLTGGNAWGYDGRGYAYTALAIVSVLNIFLTRKINLDLGSKLFFVWLTFLFFNSQFSYSVTSSMKFFRFYAILFLFVISPISEEFWGNYLKITRIILVIVGISILVSIVNPSLFYKVFSFILGSDGTKFLDKASNGQYAGLAAEIAEAAVLMVYGIAIEWADILTNGIKKKNLILMVLFFAGLTLTTKRTLFALAIVIPLGYFLVQDQTAATRIKSIALIAVVAVIAFILLQTVPVLNTILERFMLLEEDESMGGRTGFWLFCYIMFQESPITGLGYGSFNRFYNENGGMLLTKGEWHYYGHNIYLEALGEIGIIGIIFLFVPLIVIAIWGLFAFKKKEYVMYKKEIIIWSFFLIMLLLYGITGNCIYYPQQICMIIISAYRLSLIRNMVRKEKVNNFELSIRGEDLKEKEQGV